jgi:hypothetical protein
MVEDAGIIQAEIRLDIDNLMKGAMEAQKAIKNLEAEIKKSKAEINNAFREGTRAVFDYNVELKNIALAEKTGSITSQEAARARLTAAQKYLNVLIDVRNRIAEVEGEESKQVAIYDDLIKKQVELRNSEKKNVDSAKKIGDSVKRDIKNPFEEAGKQIKVFGVELGSLGKFGTALAVMVTAFKALSGLISNAIQRSREYLDTVKLIGLGYKSAAGSADAFWESLGKIRDETKNADAAFTIASERMGGALDVWKMKITGVISVLGGLLFRVKETDVALRTMQNANIDNYRARATAEKAYEDELENIQYLQNALSGTRESAAEAEKEADAARLSANELYIRQLIQIRNNLLEAEIIDDQEVDAIRFKIREQVKLLADQKKQTTEQTKQTNLLDEAKKTYNKTLAQIKNQEDAYYISGEEANARRLQAEQQYIQTLSGLRNEYRQLEDVTEDQLEDIAALEAAHIAEANSLEKVINYQKEYAADTERLRGEYEKISAEMSSQATFDEMMAKETERRTAQLERQRDAELEELDTRYRIIEAERDGAGLTEEEVAHRDTLTEAINKNYDALRRLETMKDITAFGEELGDQYRDITRSLAEQEIMRNKDLTDREKELALNELAREASLAELDAQFRKLEAQRGGLGLTAEELALREQLTGAINRNYDAVASGIREAEEDAIDFKAFAISIAEASVSAFTDITSAMAAIARQQADDAIAEIDRVLEEANKRIEEQRTAALEAEGFIEAERAENMRAQIDAARDANDQILQYQLERRQREKEINEAYDAQAKEAEDKAKKDKAEAEYGAAKTSWEMQLAAAWASLPMTVMSAIQAGWSAGSLIPVPWVAPALAATYAGLAGAAAGVQIEAIRQAEPRLKFADGGIVPGQPHAKVDSVLAAVTPGELILNRAQQETVAAKMGGDMTVDIFIDAELLGKKIIEDYVNKGRILIEAKRGIR